MADESDDSADEREVLTNLPKTRPARRSARRTTAASDPKPAPKPRAKRPPAKPPAATPPEPPPLPPQPEPHRSLMTDVAVAGIEFTGAVFHLGIDLTRAVLRATLARLPRP